MKIDILETTPKGLTGDIDKDPNTQITVVMPATNLTQALQAAQRMTRFAGIPMHMLIIHDFTRQGFIKTINEASNLLKPPYLAYVAQDSLAGKNWLLKAYNTLNKENKSVCAFNDGIQNGLNAIFGLVKTNFTSDHYGQHNIFHTGYIKHRADDELSLIAKLHNQYTYAPKALLMEVDYNLQKTIHPADIKLYATRHKTLIAQHKK